MTIDAAASAALLRRLNELFTRAQDSMAAYASEAQPYTQDEDAPLLRIFGEIREDEERHARLLAATIESFGAVPAAGAFPWWYRDLNYLTVPYLGDFTRRTLRRDVELLDALLEAWPDGGYLSGEAALETIRADKRRRIATLEAVVRDALAREADGYEEAARTAREAREVIEARRKEAQEAARKQARAKAAPSPAAGAPPGEALSPKERARQAILAARATRKADGGAAPEVPDPNEEGISPKEKARRQILKMRAAKSPAPAADLPDPDEEGISPKEKARRQVLRMRAQRDQSAK